MGQETGTSLCMPCLNDILAFSECKVISLRTGKNWLRFGMTNWPCNYSKVRNRLEFRTLNDFTFDPYCAETPIFAYIPSEFFLRRQSQSQSIYTSRSNLSLSSNPLCLLIHITQSRAICHSMPPIYVSPTIFFSGERRPTTCYRSLAGRECAKVLFDVKMTLVNMAIKLSFGREPRVACRALVGTGMIFDMMVVVTGCLESLLTSWPSTFDPGKR